MSTGPNQILIKRSDVAGVVPSGLSFGEPAINSSDGVLFFSQQTEGSATNDLWEFRGFTNEGFVRSVNGATGAIKAVSSVGISNATGFSNISGIAFASTTPGLTLSVTQHGDTAAISIDADSLISSLGLMPYKFTTISGALNAPDASSNGEFIFNTDTNRLSIFKFGSGGEDHRTILSRANALGSGQIQFRVGSSTANQTFIMYYDTDALNYDGTNFDLEVYGTVPEDVTGAAGKSILVTMVPDGGQVNASKHFRLPDGNTFGTVVTSFNGETGDILTSDDHLHVAGLSCDGGITLGGHLSITGGSDILLHPSSKIFSPNENSQGSIEIDFGQSDGRFRFGELGDEVNNTSMEMNDKTSSVSFFASGHGVTAEVTGTLHVKHRGASTNAGGISAEGGSTFGSTLQVDGNIHTNAGISADGGISGGHIHCATLTSDGTSNVGGVLMSGGVMVGTATSALTATSATSATNATNVSIQAVSDDTDYRVIFAQHAGGGTSTLNSKVDTGSGADGLIYNPSTDLLSLGGISAGAGCTFSDKVNIGATLDVQQDLTIGNGRDIVFDGSSSSQIIQNGNQVALFDDANGLVRFPVFAVDIEQRLSHEGDSDTFLDFTSDNVKLSAGGNVFIDADATNTTIEGSTLDAGIIHTQGISSDGGATFGGDVAVESNTGSISVAGGNHGIFSAASSLVKFKAQNNDIFSASGGQLNILKPLKVSELIFDDGLSGISLGGGVTLSGDITVDGSSEIGGLVHAKAGISSDGGITFPDGTHQSTALRTDSYTGQIETVSDKTYTIDPFVSTARTITGYFIQSGSGTVTATLKNGSNTVKAASVSTTSGDQSSLSNTSVAAGATLSIVTSSNSSATDVIFNVEYTSSS